VAKQGLACFLSFFEGRLGLGGGVVFVDNRYVEGSSMPVAGWDDAGNSDQERALADVQPFHLLKNCPREGEIRSALAARGEAVNIAWRTYHRCASYRVSW
jgi:demethylmenaquinone methyltransferase/2-methoxy-6-polyprenyl-1,4-benzoquinol methylase